ncbi:LysM peptidoglycan-binding domain-containing protein [Thermosipho ferrireducens]|uniref:LysM peptidoglycan-binding domain-containing protein n=1 Tax=Thermosipho ferrireducens TaxID=2571116 RepID=A0ABX7S5R5_9BACT|nr:3D domain-containing protein [Thermosipho ferrireducens]QTA37897.1 LysM peptidoglycan-binding domain-containing protein [Thermosipho ferrireducens]
MAKYAWLSLIIFILITIFSGCNFVSQDEFSSLVFRVENLEQQIKYNANKIENIESELSKISSRINVQIDSIDERVKKLEKNYNYQYLENFIKKVAKELANVQSQLNQVTAELSAFDLKTFIYRINYVEDLAKNLELDKVNNKLNDISTRFENSIEEVLKMERKLKEIETTVSALQSTVIELQQVKSATNTSYVQASTLIMQQLNKISLLEKEITQLSRKVEKISYLPEKESLERNLALTRQISEELSFLKTQFSKTDIVDLLKLRTGYINYIIRPGDTLYQISTAFKLGKEGISRIISINNIKDPKRIRPGQVIKIPVDNPKDFIKIPIKISPENIVGFFGETKDGVQNLGIDIEAYGKNIYPILPGRVTVKGNNVLYIDHGSGITAVYRGLETNYQEGDWVVTDKPLGQSLTIFHFEIWIDGEPRDPFKLFFDFAGTFDVTFYTPWDDGKIPEHPTFRLTRLGSVPKEWYTVAVDPTVIPLGSLVYIPMLKKLLFVAEDTGSAIKGKRLDIYIEDVRIARINSTRPFEVYILKNKNWR